MNDRVTICSVEDRSHVIIIVGVGGGGLNEQVVLRVTDAEGHGSGDDGTYLLKGIFIGCRRGVAVSVE